jgi:hypothetical protein
MARLRYGPRWGQQYVGGKVGYDAMVDFHRPFWMGKSGPSLANRIASSERVRSDHQHRLFAEAGDREAHQAAQERAAERVQQALKLLEYAIDDLDLTMACPAHVPVLVDRKSIMDCRDKIKRCFRGKLRETE